MDKTKMKIRVDFDGLGTNKGDTMITLKHKKKLEKKLVTVLDFCRNGMNCIRTG